MLDDDTNPLAGDGNPTTFHVRAAIRGDGQSVEWIVRRFTPILMAQAEYRLDARVRAVIGPDDLVNEVWLRALPRLSEFAVPGGERATPPVVGFLSRILLNQINNLYRKMIRGKPERDDIDGETHLGSAESRQMISRVIESEERSVVDECIAELSDSDREILVLRGIEHNSNQEIAVLLGIEPNTAAVRYRRALDKVRRRLPRGILDELAPAEA